MPAFIPPSLPLFFAPQPAAALDSEGRLLLRAARQWVMVACRRQSPRAAMAALLGSSGPRFGRLMAELTSAWPEPFTTYPPCATILSADEATMLALLRAAGTNDPAGFHRQLQEMLPRSVRDRLWQAAVAVAADWMVAR